MIHEIDVFPACAGMFLEIVMNEVLFYRFPRVRGDVPKNVHDALATG